MYLDQLVHLVHVCSPSMQSIYMYTIVHIRSPSRWTRSCTHDDMMSVHDDMMSVHDDMMSVHDDTMSVHSCIMCTHNMWIVYIEMMSALYTSRCRCLDCIHRDDVCTSYIEMMCGLYTIHRDDVQTSTSRCGCLHCRHRDDVCTVYIEMWMSGLYDCMHLNDVCTVYI